MTSTNTSPSSTPSLAEPGPESERLGLVLSASRRHVLVTLDGTKVLSATVAARGVSAVTGDRARIQREAGEYFVTGLLPRRNTLARSYRGETRPIAANIDHLYIVAAVPPLLNTLAVDRVGVVAHAEGIPWSMIVNKVDLGVDACDEILRQYECFGVQVLRTAAKFDRGLDELKNQLQAMSGSTVALCGVSGVGKSTILNKLVPEAGRVTAEVSLRTGQGKQTTTQALGFLFPREGKETLSIIDLPGIQQFGVAHLSRAQVRSAFEEFSSAAMLCGFSDCAHLKESDCGVKAAVAGGTIPLFRYESYCHMCQEVDDAKPY